MSSHFDLALFAKCLALAERGATLGEQAASLVPGDRQNASWNEAAVSWICDRQQSLVDDAAPTELDGFENENPEPAIARASR